MSIWKCPSCNRRYGPNVFVCQREACEKRPLELVNVNELVSPRTNAIITDIMDPFEPKEPTLELTIEEVRNLQKFLYDSGYISYEFHYPIHILSRRIDDFLKDK